MFLFDALGGLFSLFGGSSQADAIREAGELTFDMETENAAVRRDMSIASLRMQRTAQRVGYMSTAMNLGMARQQVNAKKRNAQRIRDLVEYNSRKDREGISRQSEQFDRLFSTQRSMVGMSGVTTEGAPMEVMNDSLEQAQHTLSDMSDQANTQRAAGLQEAVNLDYEAKWQNFLNGFNRRQFRRTRKLEGFGNWLGRVSARQQYRSDMMQAEINLRLSQAQASAQQSDALASSIQTIGSALFGSNGPLANIF